MQARYTCAHIARRLRRTLMPRSSALICALCSILMISCRSTTTDAPSRLTAGPPSAALNKQDPVERFSVELLELEHDLLSQGDVIASVVGPTLKAPISVPIWLEIDAEPDDSPCRAEAPLIEAIDLGAGRILVTQQAPLCARSICRIWDRPSQQWLADDACPDSPTAHFSLERLEGSTFFLYGYTEGPGMGQIIEWEQGVGQHVLLDHISSPTSPASDGLGGWIVESVCDPNTGEAAVSIDPHMAQCDPQERCGYCVLMHAEPVKWRWALGVDAKRLLR